MQVGGGDPIVPEFRIENVASKNLNQTGKPSKEKSKAKSVDNLKMRIKDDYQPKCKASKGLVYPKGAETPTPIINITKEKSSLIDYKLPLDVLKIALSNLDAKDLVSASMVSKYWGYASFEAAKVQEIWLFNSLVSLVTDNMSEEYPHIAKKILKVIKNTDFTLVKDLPDLKDILVHSRFKIIEILSKLKDTDLRELEVPYILLNKKPAYFDILFDLVRLHKKFNYILSSKYLDNNKIDECVRIVKSFCDLESLDMAFNALKLLKNIKGKYELRAHPLTYILNSLLQMGNIEKVMELALPLNFQNLKARTILDLFLLGKIEEGIILAETFSPTQKKIFLDMIPLAHLIQKGDFNNAVALGEKFYDYYTSLMKNPSTNETSIMINALEKKADQASYMIDRALELSCYKLIKEGKYDECQDSVNLMGKNLHGSNRRENVIKALAIELVNLNRFDLSITIANQLDVTNIETESRIMEIVIALFGKGKIEEVYNIKGLSRFYRDIAIRAYNQLLNGKCDTIYTVRSSGLTYDLILQFIVSKYLDADDLENARLYAFEISDPVIRAKTLKNFRRELNL